MSDIWASLASTWERISGAHVPQAAFFNLPDKQCLPEGSAGNWIYAERMYFTVRLNEMFLAENRKWFVDFDPLVLIVTEFLYGRERVVIPAIVGPELIPDPKRGGAPKYGSVIRDSIVAGPYPYRGGDVKLSVRFYQTPTTNLVRSVMKSIGGLARLSGLSHEVDIAGAILTGVEGLLGLDSTKSIAAYQGSLNPSSARPFRAQVAALVTPPAPEAAAGLWSVDGRLCTSSDGARGYTASDFVLVSVEGSETRGDFSRLPFGRQRGAAMRALIEGKKGRDRAEGILLTAYGDMLDSPDMTTPDADRIFDEWDKEFKRRKDDLKRKGHLGPDTGEESTDPKILARISKLDGAVDRIKR